MYEFSNSSLDLSGSKSSITLQSEVLFNLHLHLRLDLVLAFLFSLAHAVADQSEVEDHCKYDDKDELAASKETQSGWLHEVSHVPQRLLNVELRRADVWDFTDSVRFADCSEDLFSLQLTSVRVAVNRDSRIHTDAQVVNLVSISRQHAIMTTPIACLTETFIHALVDLLFIDTDRIHHMFGTFVLRVRMPSNASYSYIVHIIPPHMVVPFVI